MWTFQNNQSFYWLFYWYTFYRRPPASAPHLDRTLIAYERRALGVRPCTKPWKVKALIPLPGCCLTPAVNNNLALSCFEMVLITISYNLPPLAGRVAILKRVNGKVGHGGDLLWRNLCLTKVKSSPYQSVWTPLPVREGVAGLGGRENMATINWSSERERGREREGAYQNEHAPSHVHCSHCRPLHLRYQFQMKEGRE